MTPEQRRAWNLCVHQREALVKGWVRGSAHERPNKGFSSADLDAGRKEAEATYPFVGPVPRVVAEKPTGGTDLEYRWNVALNQLEYRRAGEHDNEALWSDSTSMFSPKATKERIQLWYDLVMRPTESGILPDPEKWY